MWWGGTYFFGVGPILAACFFLGVTFIGGGGVGLLLGGWVGSCARGYVAVFEDFLFTGNFCLWTNGFDGFLELGFCLWEPCL